MFTTIVLLLASALLVLAAAATRGLLHIDDVLKVVEPGDPEPALSHTPEATER